jgi:antitoxin component of MazEF toxin-antitoxin module
MLKRKLIHSGNSLAALLPAHFVQALGMKPGDDIEVEMVGQTIVLHPPIDVAERARIERPEADLLDERLTPPTINQADESILKGTRKQ